MKKVGPVERLEASSLSICTQPNGWHRSCCHHVVTFLLTPLAGDKALLRTSSSVHEDVVEGVDYAPANPSAGRRSTNQQDGYLSALNHPSIRTDGYRQGLYAPEETLIEKSKGYYMTQRLFAFWGAAA